MYFYSVIAEIYIKLVNLLGNLYVEIESTSHNHIYFSLVYEYK